MRYSFFEGQWLLSKVSIIQILSLTTGRNREFFRNSQAKYKRSAFFQKSGKYGQFFLQSLIEGCRASHGAQMFREQRHRGERKKNDEIGENGWQKQ